ncbi:MAG: sugar nucleotide-binding protein [Pseudomonadota bacterium]
MTWLVLGATGLFGQAVLKALARRGVSAVGCARKNADIDADLSDPRQARTVLGDVRADVVVNAAAITSLDACEANPPGAFALNAALPEVLTGVCKGRKTKLVQISTDHFYAGDGSRLHDERFPVMVLNHYARTKHAGEAFAACVPGAFVMRTNITGARGWAGRPTFAEWAFDALENRKPLNLFTDYYTSTVDAATAAAAMIDLVERDAAGLYNVAAREAASKKDFVVALAETQGIALDWAEDASVKSLSTPRADSCGLDVAKAENMLGRRLPTVRETAAALALQCGRTPKADCAVQGEQVHAL